MLRLMGKFDRLVEFSYLNLENTIKEQAIINTYKKSYNCKLNVHLDLLLDMKYVALFFVIHKLCRPHLKERRGPKFGFGALFAIDTEESILWI